MYLYKSFQQDAFAYSAAHVNLFDYCCCYFQLKPAAGYGFSQGVSVILSGKC